MMRLKLVSKSMIFLFLFGFSLAAHANLLITPTRLVLDTRDRATHVNLVNTSSSVKTYRIELVDYLQHEAGGYLTLEQAGEDKARVNTAQDLVRYSPRQVTLGPNESQRIRVSVRRPAGLADGEYRSHLSFTLLPEAQKIEQFEESKTGIHVLVSFTIPVVVRQGEVRVNATIGDVELIQDSQRGDHARVIIQREGDFGVFGTATIEWRADASSNYQQVGEVNSAAVYRENARFSMQVPLEAGGSLKPGWYRITYKGDEFFGHRVFDSKEFKWQP